MERPSIRQLESLVAVADTRSFRKAATVLGISQPALSAQGQAAGQGLGLRVRERGRGGGGSPGGGGEGGRGAGEALTGVAAVGAAARQRSEPLVGALRM